MSRAEPRLDGRRRRKPHTLPRQEACVVCRADLPYSEMTFWPLVLALAAVLRCPTVVGVA